ncbi:hypothetical protein HDU87_003623 [Geranomyces variabilis]|uniref:Peptidase S54 rhomboid domain-containing protein n=1 Tax=Geranomyces variabilis TaxID=109894 RepID=A0AAD5TJM4_9FUNG|nr:hypothetical protein HDU87_003623 [Geranomyces variabilis]
MFLATIYTPCARRGLALSARLFPARPYLPRHAGPWIYSQPPLSQNLDYALSSHLANSRSKSSAARQAARQARKTNKGPSGNAQNSKRVPPTPPSGNHRVLPNPPSNGGILTPGIVVKGLIGINVAVFLAWQYAELKYRTTGDSKPLAFMLGNFTISPINMHSNPWATLTASVSHSQLWHIGVNMYVLWNFAPAVMTLITPRQFLALYALAGLGCSIASILNSIWDYNNGHPIRGSKGASGSIAGAMMMFALAMPRFPLILFGLIEVPALAGIGGFALIDLACWWTRALETVDNAGHMGGAAVGAAFWMMIFL